MSDFLRKLNTKTMIVTHICPISLYNHLCYKDGNKTEMYDVVNMHRLLCEVADNIHSPGFDDEETIDMLSLNQLYSIENLLVTEQLSMFRGSDGEFYECPIIFMTTRISS